MSTKACVVVLGASGSMGRRVVDLLARELPEICVAGACRHPDALTLASAHRLDLDDPTSFAAALEGARALVHAAGPFHHDPGPLVRACLEAGVDYLDLAEDPAFVARVVSTATSHGGAARVVPGCSTAPGMLAVLARRFAGEPELASVEAFLSLGSRNPVSSGLLQGLLRPLGGTDGQGGHWFASLEHFRFADGRRRSFGRYPVALEKGVAMDGRSVPLELQVGFDRGLLNRALVGAGWFVPRLSHAQLTRVCGVLLPWARAARAFGSGEGRLALVARDAAGGELARLEVRAEAEGLDVPVAPVLWALRALLQPSRELPVGVVPLEQLVTASQAIDWLTTRGYRVIESGS